jgi:hypothetical protein
MIRSVLRFVIFRVLGARVLLVLTVLGWVRNRLRARPADDGDPSAGKVTRRTG